MHLVTGLYGRDDLALFLNAVSASGDPVNLGRMRFFWESTISYTDCWYIILSYIV